MRAEPPPAITRLFPTGGRLFWKFFLAFWIALLIAAGADPAATNKEGKTAADWARRRGMLAVAARLERATDA